MGNKAGSYHHVANASDQPIYVSIHRDKKYAARVDEQTTTQVDGKLAVGTGAAISPVDARARGSASHTRQRSREDIRTRDEDNMIRVEPGRLNRLDGDGKYITVWVDGEGGEKTFLCRGHKLKSAGLIVTRTLGLAHAEDTTGKSVGGTDYSADMQTAKKLSEEASQRKQKLRSDIPPNLLKSLENDLEKTGIIVYEVTQFIGYKTNPRDSPRAENSAEESS